MFQTNEQYTKKEIYKILKVPLRAQKGAWNTGYREYKGAIFIFANIGVAGRTGHDYDNHWQGPDLTWYAKTTARLHQALIQKMLDPQTTVYIFTRDDDRAPYIYQGIGTVKRASRNSSPVKLTWALNKGRGRARSKITIKEAMNDKDKKAVAKAYRARNGQSQLKSNLMRLYGGKCCISGEPIEEILHACHIVPHASSGNNKSTNGLLLRSDIHDLFDSYLIGINPVNLTIAVKKSLRKTHYYAFHGVKLARRSDGKKPDLRGLQKRWEEFSKRIK
jgi:hypothetical protein